MPSAHTCDVCHGSGTWNDKWQYYGSVADLDEGLPVLKTCSNQCRSKVTRLGGPDKLLNELRIKRLGYYVERRGTKVVKKYASMSPENAS